MSPSRALRPCAQPGCSRLVRQGRCPLHRWDLERARGWRHQRGYDRAHYVMRARIMREEAYCRACGANGQATDHADHIVPLSQGGSEVRENYQRLCASCNARKRQQEGGR